MWAHHLSLSLCATIVQIARLSHSSYAYVAPLRGLTDMQSTHITDVINLSVPIAIDILGAPAINM